MASFGQVLILFSQFDEDQVTKSILFKQRSMKRNHIEDQAHMKPMLTNLKKDTIS